MPLEEHQNQLNEFPKDKKKILIVDDDQTILYMLKRFFTGKGFQVFSAKDGLAAVEILKMENPAVVLTDFKMPFFSGMDLIKFIGQNRKDVPIMVMTAYPSLYAQRMKEGEVAACFEKPFDVDEVFSSIVSVLGG